mgnify:CR=1 FL=1
MERACALVLTNACLFTLYLCTQAARFPKGNKELSVSLFQTIVRMLFNDADAISFEVRLGKASNN